MLEPEQHVIDQQVIDLLAELGEAKPTRREWDRLRQTQEWQAFASGDDEAQPAVEILLDGRRLRSLAKRVRPSHGVSKASAARVWARSVATYELAKRDEEVRTFVQEELDGPQVPHEQLEEWIHRRRDAEPTGPGKATLAFSTPKYTQHIQVVAGGWLSGVRDTANGISKRYAWSVPDTVAYLLSGAIPIVEVVNVSTKLPRSGKRIVLNIELTATEDDVVRAYQQARLEHRAGVAPQDLSFELLGEWIALGRPTFTAFASMWNAEHGTGLTAASCGARIRKAKAFLGVD